MSDSTANGLVLAADGTPVKRSLSRSMRRQKMRAFMLVAPLLIFVLLTFIYPIGVMLSRSVQNDIVPETLPETVRVLGAWDSSSGDLPNEVVYAAFMRDMSQGATPWWCSLKLSALCLCNFQEADHFKFHVEVPDNLPRVSRCTMPCTAGQPTHCQRRDHGWRVLCQRLKFQAAGGSHDPMTATSRGAL